MSICIYLRIGTQSLPGWGCAYICTYTHRVYMCMRIFTYMCLRLDVGVYIGRMGTQSLHVGVRIHTEFTCGYICLYVFTNMHTEFTLVCVYIFTHIHTEFTCVRVYIYVHVHRVHMCVYLFTYMDTEVVCGYIHVRIWT